VLVLAYIFLYGPGVRVWSTPPGFDKITEDTFTVFSQRGMEDEAAAVMSSVRDAESAILAFWGHSEDFSFDFPVDVYLCRSPRRYWHLVMNRAKGSAGGNDLLIHASYPEDQRTPYMTHELAHLYVVNELGWLRTRLYTPAWLDEGIATTLQASHWNDRDGLWRFTSRCGELAPLTTTGSALRWLGAVTVRGDRAGAQYAYVRAFTEDLIERFGRQKVLDFFVEATLSGDHSAAFSESFGVSLEQAEREWLADAIHSGLLPADLELVDRGLPVALLVKLVILAAMATFVAMWLFRQASRVVRTVLGWRTGRAASP
jgi:hypothetical protein